jgi:hypothetical protein
MEQRQSTQRYSVLMCRDAGTSNMCDGTSQCAVRKYAETHRCGVTACPTDKVPCEKPSFYKGLPSSRHYGTSFLLKGEQ